MAYWPGDGRGACRTDSRRRGRADRARAAGLQERPRRTARARAARGGGRRVGARRDPRHPAHGPRRRVLRRSRPRVDEDRRRLHARAEPGGRRPDGGAVRGRRPLAQGGRGARAGRGARRRRRPRGGRRHRGGGRGRALRLHRGSAGIGAGRDLALRDPQDRRLGRARAVPDRRALRGGAGRGGGARPPRGAAWRARRGRRRLRPRAAPGRSRSDRGGQGADPQRRGAAPRGRARADDRDDRRAPRVGRGPGRAHGLPGEAQAWLGEADEGLHRSERESGGAAQHPQIRTCSRTRARRAGRRDRGRAGSSRC